MTPEDPQQRDLKIESTIKQIYDFIYSDDSEVFNLNAPDNKKVVFANFCLAVYPNTPGQPRKTKVLTWEEQKSNPYTRIVETFLLKDLAGVDSQEDRELVEAATDRLIKKDLPMVVVILGLDSYRKEEIATLFAVSGMSLQHAMNIVKESIETRSSN